MCLFCSKIDRRVDKTLLVSLMALLILCEEEADNDERQHALQTSVSAQMDTVHHRDDDVTSPVSRRKKTSTVTWAEDVHNRPSVPPCTCTVTDIPLGQSATHTPLNGQLQTSRRRTNGATVTQCGIDCGMAIDVWTRWSCRVLSVRPHLCDWCEHRPTRTSTPH